MQKISVFDLSASYDTLTSSYTQSGLSDATIHQLRTMVWDFYQTHGRSLPWRDDCSLYSVFISEIMLQQTQVDRVIPKYTEWMERFPDFTSLADASTADIIQQWQGLGYNRRALFLKNAAETIVQRYAGRLPHDLVELCALPGIGKYTASAFLAFAFNKPVTLIETNIRTVFIYFFFHDQTNIRDTDLLPLIEKTQDTKNPREWYWALMDLGSYIKSTVGNISRSSKHYIKQSSFNGSNRQIRGLVLRALSHYPNLTLAALIKIINRDEIRVKTIIAGLENEGFIEKRNRRYMLTGQTRLRDNANDTA